MSAVGDPHPAASNSGVLHFFVVEAPELAWCIHVNPRAGGQDNGEPAEGHLVFEADDLSGVPRQESGVTAGNFLLSYLG